jgi:XTP/dITP diphosphohydrolase
MLEPANPANPYTVLVSTRNAHKLVEIRQILGPSFELLDLSSVPALGEVEETGTTFEENAALKALAASAHFGGWVLADDSGLEVDALGGEPGVRSARFSGEGATDVTNRALLLEKLATVPADQRSARFRCVIALARGGQVLAHFSGAVEGAIIQSEKGDGGFGYDPLFVPEGFGETFAELGAETKNRLSHRGRALAALKSWPGWVR